LPLALLAAFGLSALAQPSAARSETAPVLGVHVVELDFRQLDELNVDFGVKVVKVTPGSAAEAAGLKPGDVIVEVAGKPVYSPARLRHLVLGLKTGDKFTVAYQRDGRKSSVEARLPAAPASDAPRKSTPQAFLGPWLFPRARLGVLLQELTDELRAVFGAESGSGVLVAEVLPDTPAKKAGVLAGDVIVRVERREIRRIADVHRALSCFEAGDEVTLSAIRDKKPVTLTVKLEAAAAEAPHGSGREFLEQLPQRLREMLEQWQVPAEPLPGPGV
jgi:serine protease Do